MNTPSPRTPARRRMRIGAAVVTAAVCVLFAAPAFAATPATPGPALFVRRVDSTNPAKVAVTFTYAGKASELSSLKVEENGKSVDPSTPTLIDAKHGSATATVVIVDASASAKLMLPQFQQAAQAFLAATQGSGKTAIVETNKLASLRTPLTADTNALTLGLASIKPGGDGGVWAGVESAVRTLADAGNAIPNIVILTDGNGVGTTLSQADTGVIADVVASGATVYTLAVNAHNLDPASFRLLAEKTGGQYVQVSDISTISTPLQQFGGDVAGTYQFTYASSAPSGLNGLSLDVGSSSTRVSYSSGALATGTNSLQYVAPIATSGVLHVKYFREHGKLLGTLLVVLAAILGAYAVGLIFVRDTSGLSAVLRPYSDGYTTEEQAEDAPQGAAQTAIIQRAVELTGQIAESRGLLTKVEDQLERANLPLRAAEAIFFFAAASGILTLLVLVLSRSPLVALVSLVIFVMVPPAVLNFLAKRRTKKFQAQLPDMLQLLSGTLRAGYSMMQGVEAVSQEVEEPMGRELRRVVTEARLGRPLEESLDAVADRMGSPDFAWAVMAIRIQREVGGNLSELLMTVAETMIHRERLRRDINALTAEGRVSAMVLGVLPVALGLAMWVINPDYMGVLVHETIGHYMLLGAVLLMGGGFAWMWKMIQIEV